MSRKPTLGEHTVVHTCGHSVRYIAVPLRLQIVMFGEEIAYRDAIEEHTRLQANLPCEDCILCTDPPHIEDVLH